MGRNRHTVCPHHDGIICDGIAECQGCGWFPAEEKRRIREIREQRKYTFFVRRSFVPGEGRNFLRGGKH